MELTKADKEFLDTVQAQLDSPMFPEELKRAFDEANPALGDECIYMLNDMLPELLPFVMAKQLEEAFITGLGAVQLLAFAYGWKARKEQNG